MTGKAPDERPRADIPESRRAVPAAGREPPRAGPELECRHHRRRVQLVARLAGQGAHDHDASTPVPSASSVPFGPRAAMRTRAGTRMVPRRSPVWRLCTGSVAPERSGIRRPPRSRRGVATRGRAARARRCPRRAGRESSRSGRRRCTRRSRSSTRSTPLVATTTLPPFVTASLSTGPPTFVARRTRDSSRARRTALSADGVAHALQPEARALAGRWPGVRVAFERRPTVAACSSSASQSSPPPPSPRARSPRRLTAGVARAAAWDRDDHVPLAHGSTPGRGDHAGATPMDLRLDPTLPLAETIARARAARHGGRAGHGRHGRRDRGRPGDHQRDRRRRSASRSTSAGPIDDAYRGVARDIAAFAEEAARRARDERRVPRAADAAGDADGRADRRRARGGGEGDRRAVHAHALGRGARHDVRRRPRPDRDGLRPVQGRNQPPPGRGRRARPTRRSPPRSS